MEVKVTKNDILLGYIAQIFNYGTGVIVLPVILSKLSSNEIGMNYVMLSVGALVSMADFGFSGQIGKNVTYVLSGARKIFRGEVEIVRESTVDFSLLRTIIDASKFLYRRLSLGVLFVLLTLGTIYMHHVTEGFTNVNHSLAIWILYSIGVFFNLYFIYYNSLLTGAGLIKEQRLASIYSRLTYILLCFILIFSGLGLMSVVIANLVSPFVARFYSYYKFYTKEMRACLPSEKSDKNDVKNALSDIWVTAKKSGTNAIGQYVGSHGSTFIAGIFLPLAMTAQWGLMTQLFGVVHALAVNLAMTFYPEYCKYRVKGESILFLKRSSLSAAVMVFTLTIGGLSIIILGPWFLDLIGSNTQLPPIILMCTYLLYMLIRTNAELFAMMMTSRNVIPYPAAVLLTAAMQLLFTILLLKFTNLGVWALFVGPGIAGLMYTLWKWPQMELKNMKISITEFYITGIKESSDYLKEILTKIKK